MTEVDQRVVQMRFDDSEFDEKAKKTMKTLDKLSEKLSFDAVAKKSDAALNEVVDNVEKIADKAYTIVDRVIDKIKDDIATKLVGYIKSATIDQVANGWQKYSDMTQAVGTLLSQGHKIEKVNKTLEDLSYFADETSYSFNDMLSGIAKFTASGASLDDSKVALMGIANWAAQSGQNAEVASRVFGQLAQAMGTYMKKQDWMSVQTANMDTQEFRQTALDTAVALGTLKKAGENAYISLRATTSKGAEPFTINSFVDSLTQGAWMTSEVMVETYKKYATAVEKIKDIYDETDGTIKTGTLIRERRRLNKELIQQYSEIYNVTEDIAQKELDRWSSIRKATDEEIENYAKLNKLTKEIADKKINANYYNAVAEYSKRTRKSIRETEADLEQWSEYISEFSLKAFLNAQEARTFTDVINSVKESAASAWRSIYTSIFGDYDEAKVLWTDMAEGLIGLFTDRLYKISEIFEDWKKDGGRNQMWRGLYAFGYGISSAIENVRETWDNLITDGESGVSVLNRISAKIEEAGFKFYMFVDALINNGFFQNISETLHNIKVFIDSIFGALYDGVRDAIPDGNFFLSLLLEFSNILKELSSNFKLSDTAVDGLRRTFKGLFIILNKSKKTIIELLVKVVLPILNVVFSVLGDVVECITTITGAIGDIIEYFIPLNSETSSFVTILEFLAKLLVKILTAASNVIVFITRAAVPVIGTLLGLITSLADGIANLFKGAAGVSTGSVKNTKVGKVFMDLKATILESWEPLKSLKEITDEYKDGKGFMNFLRLFGDITEGIGQRLLLTIDSVLGFIEVMSNSNLGKAISIALMALRTLVRGALWLFNNLLIPILKEVITEIGFTLESVKTIVEKDGILGLLDLIQEVFQTGIVAKLMDTIELINGVLGGNGIGKLFKKGADVLDEIAGYFNAAKLNQMADILLKVIGAIGLLYALLALITFLPEEKLDAMKERLLDFGLALGIVTASMFLISASASLAGTNLFGLAASFFGLALAINIAFSSLEKMANFLLDFDEKVVEAALAKLEHIMGELSVFILKTVLPFAGISIFGGDVSASFGSLGLVFAGIAVAIWMLVNSLKGLENVDLSTIDTLAEFISKIWLVLSGSIALIVIAAQGNEVHGIGIAIAALATSLIALKVVFPLMREIAAQKGEFDGAIEAIGLFGAFMLAFSASLFFILKGSNGLLASIGSMIMLKVFIDALRSKIMPTILELIQNVYIWAGIMSDLAEESPKKAAFKIILLAIAGLFGLFVAGMAILEKTWGEVNPLTFLFIGATIIGVTYMLSNMLIPAVRGLIEMLHDFPATDILGAALLLFLMVLPILSLARMFRKVIEAIQEIYDGFTNFALVKMNVGIVTREFNFVSSVMQSIMLTFVGIYGAMIAIMAVAGNIDWTPSKITAILLMFAGAFALTLAISAIFVEFTVVVQKLSKFEGITRNAKTLGGGIIKSTEDSMTRVIKAMTGVVNLLLVTIIAIIGISGTLAYLASMGGKINDLTTMMITVAIVIGVIFAGAYFFLRFLTTTVIAIPAGTGMAKTLNAITGIMGMVTAIFAIVVGLAIYATEIAADQTKYDNFVKNITLMGIILGICMVAISILVKVISKILKNNTILTSLNGPGANSQYKTTSVDILIVLAGLVGIISSIGLFLLPAVAELSKMDIGKVIVIFIGIITLILVNIKALVKSISTQSIVSSGIRGISNIGWTEVLKVLVGVVLPLIAIGNYLLPAVAKLANENFGKAFGILLLVIGLLAINMFAMKSLMTTIKYSVVNPAEILNIVKMFVGLIAPILTFAYAFNKIADAFDKMKDISEEKINSIKSILLLIAAIAGVGVLIGALAGAFPNIATGIITVAAAISLMVIAFAKLSEAISGFNNDIATGINDGFKNLNDTVIKGTDQIVGTINKGFGVNSPSKEMEKTGKYLDQGLAKGIKSNMNPVKRAITTLAGTTTGTFDDLLGIASPSKVFYKDGRFIVAGLVNGLNSQKSSVEDVSAAIGDAVKSGIEGIKIDTPDIFGGKDPIEYIKGAFGDLDAGSLLGKALGLDNGEDIEAQIKTYQDELDLINKNAAEQGGIDAGTARRASWLTTQIENLTKDLNVQQSKSNVEKFFDKVFDSDIVQKIGEKFGIDFSSGASGQSVLRDLKNNFIGGGINDPDSILGGIVKDIKESDWWSVGTSIGGKIADGVKKSGIGKTIMKVGNMFGAVTDKEYAQYLAEIGETGEAITTVMKSQGLTFSNLAGNVLMPGANTMEIIAYQKNIEATVEETKDLIGTDYMNMYSDWFSDEWLQMLAMLGFSSRTIAEEINNGFLSGWHTGSEEIDGYVYTGIGRLIKKVEKQLGIASPSKVFKWIAEMCGEGSVLGIEESTPKITDALADQTSEEYRTMSLGMQALDQLVESGTAAYTPQIVPTLDTSELGSSIDAVNSAFRIDPSRVDASLSYDADMNYIAQSQYAMAGAIDNLRNDILTALASGELVKVDVETHTDESNLFDFVVRQNRLKYNRTGINSMLT